MNKRITSLALVFVMVLSMLATAVPAYALSTEAPITVTIEPNVKTASPGDTITYTVYVGPIKRFQSANFTLIIPEGLTYIVGNHIEGLKEILGSDKADYTDSTKTMIVSGGGSYNSDEKTALMTFSCTVDEGTVGKTLQITFEGDEDFSDDEYETYETTYDFNSSNVTITSAPKPAESITLNKSELTLTVGGNETLTATVTPTDTTDTVVWSSESDAVATVDSHGNVNAVGVGETKITATAGAQKATCTVKVEAAPCTHDNKTTVPEKDSDCTSKGWDEYKECDDCHALFNTSGAPITEIPYRDLDPNAHTFGSWIDEVSANCTHTGTKGHKDCTLCGKHFDNDDAEIADLTIPTNDIHDFDTTKWGYKGADGHAHVCTRNPAHHDAVVEHTSSGSATEDTAETCTVCGYVITPATGHVCANHLSKVDRVEADCTNPGNIEHYKCSCGKLYEDATAARELTEDQVKRDALGHDWIDATCTEPKTCDRCGETEGTALGHNWATEWSSNADNHWHACTRCGDKDGEVAHIPNIDAPTETEDKVCTVCGYVIDTATGHECLAGTLTKVEAKAATCTDSGNKEYYKCTCSKLYWDDDAFDLIENPDEVVINALGHAESEWKTSTTEHWKVCTIADCGVEIPDSRASHADNNSDNNCDICGYAMTTAEYTITVTDGTATVEGSAATKAAAGKEVTVKADAAPSGKVFDKWVVESGTITLANANSTTTTFTMPAEAVSIKATYKSTGGSSTDTGSFVPTYSITVKDSENGDVTSSHKSAEQGTTVTLTVVPHKGYVMDKLTVLNSKNEEIKLTEKNGKYTFTMPAGKVTVEAVFKAEPFVDVPDGAYYEDAVKWAVDKEITTGTDSTHFSPDTVCTRAQAVTFLWRAAGSPVPQNADMPFEDVKKGSYYYDAVLWAVEKGITKGTDDNHFSPDDICSRAQIVTLLWRAEKSPEVGTVNPFADVKSDDYYCSAVLWAVENGITNGTAENTFSPEMNCTRAQIVTFIWRAFAE